MTTIAQIQHAVCSYYGLPMSDLLSDRRYRVASRPRHLAMYLCREMTPYSLPVMARHFRRSDHSVILHGIREMEKRLALNEQDRNDLSAIRKTVWNSGYDAWDWSI